jgi:hypothetical protein
MTLVLLLALAGPPVTERPRTPAGVGGERVEEQAEGAQAAPLGSRFRSAPLAPARPILRGPFRLVDAPQLEAGAKPGLADLAQRSGQSARVVCTIRVVRADPSIDPGILVRLPAGRPDSIVRDDLSPCVQ